MHLDKARNSQNRRSLIQSRLHDFNVEAILLFDMKNIRYLTNFTGSDGAIIIEGNHAILLVDGRYVTQARRETEDLEIYEYQDKSTGIIAVLKERKLKRVGFESTAMLVDVYFKLMDKLTDVILSPIDDQFSLIRAVKDESEIFLLKEAVEISFQALQVTQALIKPGISEMDIALELEYTMRRYGADQVSFATIVASGTNSALPHAAPGTRKIEDGDILVIDYGATYRGYHSDETWSSVVGHVMEKQLEVYELVKEAHDRALDALKNGVLCSDIDSIARTCIERGGFGKYFPHGTGHGVGLDVHEAPRIAARSENVLQTGMVVTIEPGIYIPDAWGIRIEDMALIKEDGCEILTKTPKDLRILG